MERVPFEPFLLAADATLVGDAPGLVALTRLQGAGELRWLARFDGWGAALAARERCRAATGLPANAAEAPYRFFPDPVHQYLMLAGRTSFGSLRFDDLRRLALDIEVVTGEGYEFPSAARESDRIVAIALADSTGFRRVLRGDRLDEAALLAECGRLIRERDPDVLEGHNIFRFDLEYLEARARRHGVTLAWGRDGSALRGRPARLQVAERAIGFRRYDVAGRHIVDTWMLAQLHDVGARDLPSFGLKDIARHLGVAATDRTYVDASNVARQLAEDADRLMAYAGDDALETLAISAILSPPFFAQARLVPFDYQSTTLRGSAAKVDALLLREYLRAGRAVPRPRPGQSVGGGLTAIWQQGVAAPVLHVDVTSLYPSLMIGGRVAPACDELGVFLDLLTHLRDVRVAAKRQAQAADTEEERRHQLALSQSFKILINSFYGYLGFSSAHWNDFEAANRIATMMVTKWGMGRDPEAADGGVSGRGSLSFLVPTGGRSLPSDVQAAATRAIRLILDEAYAEASRTLVAHLETLRRLAAYLVEHERVDGATFDELFDGRRAVANAENEWRAEGARPRAWGDVVDLASRRASGGAAHAPVPAPAAALAPAPSPADSGDSGVAAIAAMNDRPAAVVSATAVATSHGAIETSTIEPLSSVPSLPVALARAGRRQTGKTRRSAARRARRLAAGLFGRAEKWLRSGELEADRL